MKETCLVMIKPGILNRRIVGEVISRLEKKGPNLIGMKLLQVSNELAAKHYEEHFGKDFYNQLIEYITSGPVIAMVWEAEDCCAIIRRIVGSSGALRGEPGTIRGDYCMHNNRNVIHASDKPESAKKEVALYFTESELHSWTDEHDGKWK